MAQMGHFTVHPASPPASQPASRMPAHHPTSPSGHQSASLPARQQGVCSLCRWEPLMPWVPWAPSPSPWLRETLPSGVDLGVLFLPVKHTAILGQDRKRHTSMAFLLMVRLPDHAAAQIREFAYGPKCWLCDEGTGLLCRIPDQGYEMRCLTCVMCMLEDTTHPRLIDGIRNGPHSFSRCTTNGTRKS